MLVSSSSCNLRVEIWEQAENKDSARQIGIALKRNVFRGWEMFMKQPRVVRLVTIREKAGQKHRLDLLKV